MISRRLLLITSLGMAPAFISALAPSLPANPAEAAKAPVMVDFDDCPTGKLNGSSSGTGFADDSSWNSGSTIITIVSEHLAPPLSTRYAIAQPAETPRSLQAVTTSTVYIRQQHRALATPLTGLVWGSFLVRNTHEDQMTGITFNLSAGSGILDSEANKVRWLYARGSALELRTNTAAADPAVVIPGVFTPGETALVLFNYNTAGKRLKIWVNPVLPDEASGLDLLAPAYDSGATPLDMLGTSESVKVLGLMGNTPSEAGFKGGFLDTVCLASGRQGYYAVAGFPLPPADVISVSDFGAIPDDGKSDLAALEAAVAHAKETGAKTLQFEKGVYDLMFASMRSASPLRFADMEGFGVSGAVDEAGNPATTLLRHYPFQSNIYASYVLHAKNCKNFSLKNIIFDNNPRYASAGEIVGKDGDRVVIKIFDGNPAIEGGIIYCSNVWDMKTKRLRHVASPTAGADTDKKTEEYTLRFLDNDDKSLMYLDSPTLAPQVEVGDGFSWTFGWQGVQTGFEYCDDLLVENVWTYNAVGFCFETRASHNLMGKNVKFIAPDNQLMVCGRDAWKLYACTGDVRIEGMYVEGVRMDGQNAHGSFLYCMEKMDDKTMLFYKRGGAANEIRAGTRIGFIKGPMEEVLCTVKSAEIRNEENVQFLVFFEENVPDFATAETICNVYSWCFDSYTVTDSEFRNIAGCAVILKNRDSVYENCRFDNIMYPAVHIGASPDGGEGIIPQNVTVRNCHFISSGWMARLGAKGAVGIRNSVPVFYIRNISVTGCVFEDCDIGIQAEGVDGLTIKGNTFQNTGTAVLESGNLNARIQPRITAQPQSQAIVEGTPFRLSVAAIGASSYQWYHDDIAISGETSPDLNLLGAHSENGTYYVVVSNSTGDTASQAIIVSIQPLPVTIAEEPAGGTVRHGLPYTLSIVVSGEAGYQWRKDGVPIPGATSSTLALSGSPADAGMYDVVVTTTTGTIFSSPATVTVTPDPDSPFAQPSAVAVDSSGLIYVADSARHVIQVIAGGTDNWNVTTFAGVPASSGVADGARLSAKFNKPSGLAVRSGTLYVADTGNNSIRAINSAGIVTTLVADNDADANKRLKAPVGIAVDSSGNLYVADSGNHLIRKITVSGEVATLAGALSSAGTTDASGTFAKFNTPTGIALNENEEILYIADSGNHTIRTLALATGSVGTLAGKAVFFGGDDGLGEMARFNIPGGLLIDGEGDVYLADTGNSLIRQITSTGNVTTVAGLPGIDEIAGVPGFKDGSGTSAWFCYPEAIALAPDGSLYIADSGNRAIRAIDIFDRVTTLSVTSTTGDAATPENSVGNGSGGGGGGVSSIWLLISLGILAGIRKSKRTRSG
jgi:sugar lactone lactonase YvrE